MCRPGLEPGPKQSGIQVPDQVRDGKGAGCRVFLGSCIRSRNHPDFQQSVGAAILLIILLTVSLLDIFGSLLRKVVIEGEDHGRFALYLMFLTCLVVAIEVVLAGGA